MQVCRKQLVRIYFKNIQDFYSHRFDQGPWDGVENVVKEPPVGASHSAEVRENTFCFPSMSK